MELKCERLRLDVQGLSSSQEGNCSFSAPENDRSLKSMGQATQLDMGWINQYLEHYLQLDFKKKVIRYL